MKNKSDRDCLKNYIRLQVCSCVWLELIAETNEINTVHKNDGQPENSNDSQ